MEKPMFTLWKREEDRKLSKLLSSDPDRSSMSITPSKLREARYSSSVSSLFH